MRRATFVLLFVSLLAMSIFSAPAMAVGLVPGTYYVDISNGDNRDYGTSAETAWRELHYAIQEINSGTPGTYTLNVASGTYEVVDTEKEANTPLNITQHEVTVIGDFNSKPILSGPANPQTGEWEVGLITTGNNITIRDLEIQNFSYWGILVQGDSTTIYNCAVHDNTGAGITIGGEGTIDGGAIKRCEVYYNGTGIGIWDAQNFVVEQNYVYNNTGGETGIGIAYSSTGVEIKKNLVENNGLGIEIFDCSPLVERNEIKDNEIGIAISGNASPKIYNNLIYDTTSTMDDGIIVDGGYGGTASPELYHNTIDNGLSNGIEMYGYMGYCAPDILFNIITNFDTCGIYNYDQDFDELGDSDPSIDYCDVWNNASGNYELCSAGTNDISEDPLYASYELQSGSPCRNAILTEAGDPLTIDLPGYERPREGGYDMGAYEYVLDITHNYNLPGGTSQPKIADYRMFTIPVYVGTGADMKTTMETTDGVGGYDICKWRVFAYGSSYIEMNDEAGFSSLPVGPGDAFWAISIDELATPIIEFTGRPAPDGEYYTMPLKAGWNMFGLPWPATFPDIELGKIAASDGVNNYWITSPNNSLTQKSVWDYTGSGPSNGYVQLTAAADVLEPGKGYWIKVVESRFPVELLIPRDNTGSDFGGITIKSISGKNTIRSNYEEPPPPPGGISAGSSGIHITEKGGCFIATAAE